MTPYLSATLKLYEKLGRTPTQSELRNIGVPKAKLGYVIYYLGLPKREPGMRTDYTCDRLPVKEEVRAVIKQQESVRPPYVAKRREPEELNPNETWMR